LVKLAQKRDIRISHKTLINYSSRYDWISRAEAFDVATLKSGGEMIKDAVAQMAAEQAEAGREMRQRGLARVKMIEPEQLSLAEARIYITEGSELERIARGVTDDRRQGQPQVIKVILDIPRPGQKPGDPPLEITMPAHPGLKEGPEESSEEGDNSSW
jgi:hypothetical protein